MKNKKNRKDEKLCSFYKSPEANAGKRQVLNHKEFKGLGDFICEYIMNMIPRRGMGGLCRSV